jgi:hypothetical protein
MSYLDKGRRKQQEVWWVERCALRATFKVDWLQIPTRVTLAGCVESKGVVAQQELVVRRSEDPQWSGTVIATFAQRCEIAITLKFCVVEHGEFGRRRPAVATLRSEKTRVTADSKTNCARSMIWKPLEQLRIILDRRNVTLYASAEIPKSCSDTASQHVHIPLL